MRMVAAVSTGITRRMTVIANTLKIVAVNLIARWRWMVQ
jgi:hypothetical protein